MKVDERIPPMVDDFLYVCDDAYTRSVIECLILAVQKKFLCQGSVDEDGAEDVGGGGVRPGLLIVLQVCLLLVWKPF